MLTGKRLLILPVLLSLSLTVCAQQPPEWKTAMSNGYTYRYVTGDPMQARFYTLRNGLTVALSVNRREPRIQTLIGVRAGSNDDPREHTGLAHYLEHLLFKGTYRFGTLDSAGERSWLDRIEALYDRYNKTSDPGIRIQIYREIDSISGIAARYAIGGEYDKLMAAIGAEGTNAHTSVEETVYQENIPSWAVDKFLMVQAERFRNPVFRLFHTELEAVYEEKNRALDNDGRRVWEALMNKLFPNHNYGQQTTLGTVEHLKNPSLKAIRDFYEKYYVPGNMIIVMAGDFDPDTLIAKIDAAFSYMQPKPVHPYEAPEEMRITSPLRLEVVGPDAEFLQMGYRLPGVQDDRANVVGMVVSQLLSNGKAGLIDQYLNKEQKVLSASAGIHSWRDYGIFLLSGRAREGQSLEEVERLLLEQIDKLAHGDFDESLIPAIVANFKFAELSGLEKNDIRANALMDAFILHRGERWDKEVGFVEAMQTVTKQEVSDYVRKYLQNSHISVFKRRGSSPDIVKVEKPPITPVPLNRDAESPFFRQVQQMPEGEIQPRWMDFERDFSRLKMDSAELLHVANMENSIFRLHYRVDLGTWHEQLLSLAAGYLQYLGTDKYSAQEISRQFYNLACNFQVSAGQEYTTVSITGLQENMEKAVQLLEHLVRHCRPDHAALASLKARILRARSDAKLNKQAIAQALVNYAMYGPGNPYNDQLSNGALQAVSADTLVALLHRLFDYPQTIIYYGPVNPDPCRETLQRLHPLASQPAQAPRPKNFHKVPQTGTRVLFVPYDMVQAEITWVRNGEVYDARQAPLISLFNQYFGGDMGSLVFQTIRESKALAYSTYAYYATPNKAGDRYSTIAYVGSQADKMPEAVEAMNELFAELPRSEALLRTSKESIRKSLASERPMGDAIVFAYLSARRMGVVGDLRKTVYETVPKLGLDDLDAFYKKHVAGNQFTYCVLGHRDRIDRKALEALGEVTELSLETLFGY